MAIALEFLDFLVPIEVIRAKYRGGWEQCLIDHQPLIGGRVWYDDHLFRDGAMNPQDIKVLVDHWAEIGFATTASRDRKVCWNDVCVVEAIFGGATLPCDWIEVDCNKRIAHYRGTVPGPIVGRSSFESRDDWPR